MGNDAIWLAVDKFTKLAHFIQIKMTMIMDGLVQDYMDNIVRLYGTLVSIVSDRYARFTTFHP